MKKINLRDEVLNFIEGNLWKILWMTYWKHVMNLKLMVENIFLKS
jgi:hypothetical protein